MKVGGGGAAGVLLPIGSEYVLKGGRAFVDPAVVGSGYKYSGLLGIAEGVVGIGIAADKIPGARLSEDDKQVAAAFGGAGLATGIGILFLDEMRKKAAYTFRQQAGQRLREQGGLVRLPGRRGLEEERGFERIIEPVTPLVEEV